MTPSLNRKRLPRDVVHAAGGVGAAILLLLVTSALAGDLTLAEQVSLRIREELAGAKVSIEDSDNLRVEMPDVAKVQVNLDNLRRRCSAGDDCEAAIGDLISALKQGFGSFASVPDGSQLRIRIANRSFIDQINAKLESDSPKAKADNQPITRELTRGLWLVVVVDSPDNIRVLQRGIAAKMGKTDEELFALAVENLRKALPPPEFQPMVVNARLSIQASSTEGYDSAYVLLPDLVLQAAGKTGSRVLVSIPARDTLLLADVSDAADLKKVTAQIFAKADHPVSDGLFTLTAKGISPLAGP